MRRKKQGRFKVGHDPEKYTTKHGNKCERHHYYMMKKAGTARIDAKSIQSFFAEAADGSELTGVTTLNYSRKGTIVYTAKHDKERLTVESINKKDSMWVLDNPVPFRKLCLVKPVANDSVFGFTILLKEKKFYDLSVTKPNKLTWKLLSGSTTLQDIQCYTLTLFKSTLFTPTMYRMSSLAKVRVTDINVVSKIGELRCISAFKYSPKLEDLSWRHCTPPAESNTISFSCTLFGGSLLNENFALLLNMFVPSNTAMQCEMQLNGKLDRIVVKKLLTTILFPMKSVESLSVPWEYFKEGEAILFQNRVKYGNKQSNALFISSVVEAVHTSNNAYF